MFAKPDFRLWIPCFGGSSQTGFCLCTLRRVSDPPEPIFGPPRYFFKGVPPQPNCPPIVVPTRLRRVGERHGRKRSVFHFRLPSPRRDRIDGSRLRSAITTTSQRQAAVKLHGVFLSRWEFVDRSSTLCVFTGYQARTAGCSLFHSCTSELTRQGIWLP